MHDEEAAFLLQQEERYSLQRYDCLLESSKLVSSSSVHGLYRAFGFECLHNLHLGISKTLKQCIMEFLGMRRKARGGQVTVVTSVPSQIQAVRFMNDYIAAQQKHYPLPGVHLDFSDQNVDGREDGIIAPSGVCGMIQAKQMFHLELVFPFACACLDMVYEQSESRITDVQTAYTDMMNTLIYGPA